MPRSSLTKVAAFVTACLAALGSAMTAAADPGEPDPPAPPLSVVTPVDTPAGTPSTAPSEPGAPSSEPRPPKPGPKLDAAQPLQVSATFDKPGYRTGETMRIHFTVSNPNAEPTPKLWVLQSGGHPDTIHVDSESWGPLNTGGATIPASGSLSVDPVGLVTDPDVTTAVLAGFLRDDTGARVAEFRFTTPVTPSSGRVSGLVYGDANNNSHYDAGEELAGYTVYADNGHEITRTVSDESGAFAFPRMAPGPVTVGTYPSDSWRFGSETVTVDEDGVDGLRLRGVPSLSKLTARVAFTKNSYQPGEIARVRITLINTGPFPMGGVVAGCNRAGKEYGLSGSGPGWRELTDGVTIGAHTTRSLTASEAVPLAAFRYGTVAVECVFSYRDIFDNRSPEAADHAAVPNGGFGRVYGHVRRFPETPKVPPGVGFRGARVVLVGDDRCPIVGERRTNATGYFAFDHVPAGHYRVFVLAPQGWYISNEWAPERVSRNPQELMVPISGAPYPPTFEVRRGTGPAPALPAQPAGCTAPAATGNPSAPAPQATAGGGLAGTGANVLAAVLAGLAVIAVGAAIVVTARRRRT